jgi:hypothetical protein
MDVLFFSLLFLFIVGLLALDRVIGIKSLLKHIGIKGFSNINKEKVKEIRNWSEIKAQGADFTYEELDQYLTNFANRVIKCSDCWKAGKCVSCGCNIKGLMYNPMASCDRENWDSMNNFNLKKRELLKK